MNHVKQGCMGPTLNVRSRWFKCAASTLAMSWMAILSGCGQPNADTRPTWWFRSDLPADREYDYHSRLVLTTTIDGKVESHELESSCTLSVHANEPEDGNIITLVKHEDDFLANWMKTFCAGKSPYLRVTREALCAGDIPILVGPWRQGDRFSFIMIAALFFSEPILEAAQFTVAEAGLDEAHLVGDVWLIFGSKSPKGHCDIWLRNDKDGLAQIRGDLRIDHKDGVVEAALEMNRLAIRSRKGDVSSRDEEH